MHPEDPDLRGVDQRCHEQTGKLAGARDRERRAAQLAGLERPGTGPLGERVDVLPQLLDGTRVAAAHHGDEQALLGLHGDPEVVAVEVDDLVAFEPRVQLGKLAQRVRGRAKDEGQQHREVDAAEVALLDVGHGRDLTVRA